MFFYYKVSTNKNSKKQSLIQRFFPNVVVLLIIRVQFTITANIGNVFFLSIQHTVNIYFQTISGSPKFCPRKQCQTHNTELIVNRMSV